MTVRQTERDGMWTDLRPAASIRRPRNRSLSSAMLPHASSHGTACSTHTAVCVNCRLVVQNRTVCAPATADAWRHGGGRRKLASACVQLTSVGSFYTRVHSSYRTPNHHEPSLCGSAGSEAGASKRLNKSRWWVSDRSSGEPRADRASDMHRSLA